MKRNYFDSKATVDESLEKVRKYINDFYDRKDFDASKLYDDDETGDGLYDAGGEDNEKVKNNANWYDNLLEAAKECVAHMKALDEDKEDDIEGEKAYDDEEARDDAAFADFDRKHVSGYDDFQSDYDYYRNGPKMFNPYDEDEDDEDDDSKYLGEHFGAGFEIDEPRPEDYMDNKTFEDDLAAYKRFVAAGKDCVRRGLEKPEWANSVKIDDVSDDVDDDYDDEPLSNVKVFRKIYILI